MSVTDTVAQAPDEFCARLRAAFDAHPIPVLAAEEAGHLLYRNRLARAAFPGLRNGMRLDRFFGKGVLAEGILLQITRDEQSFLLCRDDLADHPGCRLLYLQPIERGEFSAAFSRLLLDYEKDLIALSDKSLGEGEPGGTRKQRAAYLGLLKENISRLNGCAVLLETAFSGVRDLHPGKLMPVSAGELLDFWEKMLFSPLSRRQATLHISREPGLVALLNFRDFSRALLLLIDFFLLFAFARELHLDLRRAQDGSCLFDLWARDRFDLLSMYRLFCRRNATTRDLQRESALFFPLFCALGILRPYRHPVEIFSENSDLHVRIRVQSTLEFPALIVRRDDAETEEAELFSALCRDLLLPDTFLGRVSDSLTPCEKPAPLSPVRVTRSALFE